jgi:hypothetical protein
MNFPGYYLTDPDALVVLPVAERYGSLIGIEENDIAFETERGVRYVYKQFKRKVRRMTFRMTEAQLAAFETLHNAVEGQLTPFYFVPDTDNAAVVLYVRKEPSFLPKELDEPAVVDGVVTTMYDYTLELTAEVDPISITP